MSRGELLTRLTIWITLAGYFVGAGLTALSRNGRKWEQTARLAWSIACISLIAHVVCAFHFYHYWSQEAAYRDTARQTAEVTGLDWGGGLFINYAVMAGWVAEVIYWWWRGPYAYRRLPRALVAVWQGFLLFIFFNATVVFATGVIRFIGLFICLALCLLWLYASVSASPRKPDKDIEIVIKD